MLGRGLPLLLSVVLALAPSALGCKSCARRLDEVSAGRGQPGKTLAKGLPREEAAVFNVAVYYSDQPSQPPEAALRSLATTLAPSLRVGLAPDDIGKIAGVAFMQPDIREAPPPDLDALSYFGRGLSPTDASSLAKAKRIVALSFSAPPAQAREVHAAALRLSQAFAEATKGFLYDASTREAFSIAAWASRIEKDASTVDVRHVLTNHAYEVDGAIRIVTLGMEKLGLPDVVVERVSQSNGDDMTKLVYATCQALAEGARAGDAGSLRLALDAYQNESFRSWLSHGSKKNLETSVTLAEAKRDDGDPERVIAISFPAAGGTSIAEQQEHAARALLGDRTILASDDDPELDAARKRATKRLLELKPVFQQGLPARESLSIKAAIGPKGGKEYMWMDLKSWDRDRLRGTLTNEPMNIPSLHKGATVEVAETDLFDFLLTHADGSTEGAETTKILKSRER